MSLNNINTLQNYEDLRFVNELSEQFKDTGELNTDYYIHSLANLEQRNEYKYSNGIKYGILTYNEEVIYPNEKTLNITPTSLSLVNQLSFDVVVNNVEAYLKNSQIYNDGINFKTLMFCKILGTDDTSTTKNVEIQYTNIDLSTHMLVEAYRAFHLSDNIYVLLHLYIEKDLEQNPTKNYTLKCYKIKIDHNTSLEKMFNHMTYLGDRLPDEFMFNSEYINTDNCCEPGGLFDSLKSNCLYNEETITNNYTLECIYDTVDEQFIKIKDVALLSKSYSNINDMLYFNYYKIDNYISSINNDISISYPNLLKYYSNRQFNSNDSTLKDIIARSLYKQIYDELLNEDFDEDELKTTARLIIPEGTQITYVSNVENSLLLHYTDDIYVFFINNNAKNILLHKNDASIRFEYPGIDKTILYNVISKYNTRYTDLVDNFIVVKKYTLPYIDNSHLWNINGNQTSIYASGESGGNPNILIVRTHRDKSNKIVGSHLNRTDIQQNLLTYEQHIVPINYKNHATDVLETVNYVFMIPIINEKTLDKLKYATLFATSNIAYIDGEIYDTAPQLTTIWSIGDNSTSNEARFELIYLDNDSEFPKVPLTLESMFGFDSYVYKKFSEYGHISNVFDDLVAIKLPKYPINGSETNAGRNYFVIERNTILDDLLVNSYPENAYNFNVVEFKVNDKLHNSSISYATSSEFINRYSFMEMWNQHKNDNVISPYKVSSTVKYIYIGNNAQQATQIESDDDSLISQVGTSSEGQTDIVETETSLNSLIYDLGQYEIASEDYEYNHEYINGASNIVPEYIPKAYIPIIKESNVLQQDSNLINRSNILTFDENGNVYYSYIGSSCEDTNKNVVHIGTHSNSAYVISLGTESLSSGDVDKRNEFIKQSDTLSIDFDYSYINSNVTTINNQTLNKDSIISSVYENKHLSVTRIELTHIINDYLGEELEIITDLAEQETNIDFDNVEVNLSTLLEYIKEIYKEQLKALSLDNIESITGTETITIHGKYLSNRKLVIFSRPLSLNIVIKDNEIDLYLV